MIEYSRTASGLTQAGGAVVIDVNGDAMAHQMSTTKTGGTAGTLTVEVMPTGSGRFEVLTVNGVAVTLNLADDKTFGPFDGSFDSVRVTPTGFDGTSYTVTLAGW